MGLVGFGWVWLGLVGVGWGCGTQTYLLELLNTPLIAGDGVGMRVGLGSWVC